MTDHFVIDECKLCNKEWKPLAMNWLSCVHFANWKKITLTYQVICLQNWDNQTYILIDGIIIIDLLLLEMYGQRLWNASLSFSKVSMRFILLSAGENWLKKAKSSYCHRLMTFRIVSFHCNKVECQQISEIAYCSLFEQFVPSLYSCF